MDRNKTDEYIEKLNIVLSYPVKWSIYVVMENYIQNFYDAIGYKDFGKRFRYEYDEDAQTLTMVSERGFDYKYLCGLGLSTKRNDNEYNAGKFGEGFKMAALCSYRDYHHQIMMQSENWRIYVTEEKGYVDKTEMNFLAYKVEMYAEEADTQLVIKNIQPEHYKAFIYELDSFYYLENKLFGEPIFINDKYAVFHSNIKERKKGIVFISLQKREYLDIPIILCNHSYRIDADNRERNGVNKKDLFKAVFDIIENMPADKLLIILEAMKKHWSRKGDDDVYSKKTLYNDMLHIIIDNISKDIDVRKKFAEKYSDKLVANAFWIISNNEKRMVKAWYYNSKYCKERRCVIDEFSKLDIDDMYVLCKRNDGLITERKMNEQEERCVRVLNDCGEEFFSDIYCYIKLPECRIIKDYAGPIMGQACVEKMHGKLINKYNMRVMSNIETIRLQESLFGIDKFSEAITIYLHELFHQFGGDSSMQFRKALLMMNERLLRIRTDIDKYKEAWENCFGK